MQHDSLPNTNKIAFLNAKALGDFIVTLPALVAIKSTYPDAELLYLGKPWHEQFLRSRSSPIDRVIVVPPKDGVRDEPEKKGRWRPGYREAPKTREDPVALSQFYASMQSQKIDIAVNGQGSGRLTIPFLRELGPQMIVGLRNSNAPSIARSVPYKHYQSEVHRYLELAGLIGACTSKVEPRLSPSQADLNEADTFARSVDLGQPYVVLHPGGDSFQTIWDEAKFAAVGDDLTSRGYSIVITGIESESFVADAVKRHMSEHVISAVGKLSLGGLVGLLSRADLVVSNDTGPLHVARALDTPTVGIYWFANLLNWGPLTRGRHRVAVAMELRCSKCGVMPVNPWPYQPNDTCDHMVSFVSSVGAREVIDEATDVLLSTDSLGPSGRARATSSTNYRRGL